MSTYVNFLGELVDLDAIWRESRMRAKRLCEESRKRVRELRRQREVERFGVQA